MKFCRQCGNQLEDNYKVCPKCGTKVEEEAAEAAGVPVENFTPQDAQPTPAPQQEQPQQQYQQAPQGQPVPPQQPQYQAAPKQPGQGSKALNDFIAKIKDPKNRKTVIIAAVAIVVVIIAIAIFANQKDTINVKDFVEIEYSGYDGYATAYVDYNEEYIYAMILADMDIDYSKLMEGDLSDFNLSSLGSAYSQLSKYETAIDSIKVDLNKKENISNGDELIATVTYNEKLCKKAGLKLKGNEVKVTVEGLEEVEAYNPFDDLEVSFSGISSEAICNWTYKGDKLEDWYFSADKTYDLSEGDVVTITVDVDEYTMNNGGFAITEKSREYEVTGLGHYVTDASELTTEGMATLIQDAKDVIEAAYAKRGEYVILEMGDYAGVYFLQSKSYESDNTAYVVIVGLVTNIDGSFIQVPLFMPIRFDDLIVNADGSVSYSYKSNYIEGSTDYKYDRYYRIEGYTDKTAMYNDLLVSNKANYNTSATDQLIP